VLLGLRGSAGSASTPERRSWGTLVCLSGAMCVSFLKNPTPSVSVPGDDEELSDGKGRHDWILGCFCLLTGVIIFACNTVLQVYLSFIAFKQ